MTKLKHNRERHLATEKQFWVFGGIELQSSKIFTCFLGFGGQRNKTYSDIKNLVYENSDSMNYQHYPINHSQRFVDLYHSCIHTQTIERFWGNLKIKSKEAE